MENNQEKSNVLAYSTVLKAFKKYWKFITILTVLGGVFSFLLSTFFLTPKYSSTVDILVNQKVNTQDQYTAQQADLQAINTYRDVVTKPVILKPVLKEARVRNNFRGSLGDLEDNVSINNATNSQVISISVSNKNPYVARDIANSIGRTFKQKIKKMMKVNNITIVSKATVNLKAIFPNKKIFTVVGILIGIIVGIFVALLRQYLDNTVKDPDFLTNDLGLVNLGQIYHIKDSEKSFSVVRVDAKEKNKADNYAGRRRV